MPKTINEIGLEIAQLQEDLRLVSSDIAKNVIRERIGELKALHHTMMDKLKDVDFTKKPKEIAYRNASFSTEVRPGNLTDTRILADLIIDKVPLSVELKFPYKLDEKYTKDADDGFEVVKRIIKDFFN